MSEIGEVERLCGEVMKKIEHIERDLFNITLILRNTGENIKNETLRAFFSSIALRIADINFLISCVASDIEELKKKLEGIAREVKSH